MFNLIKKFLFLPVVKNTLFFVKSGRQRWVVTPHLKSQCSSKLAVQLFFDATLYTLILKWFITLFGTLVQSFWQRSAMFWQVLNVWETFGYTCTRWCAIQVWYPILHASNYDLISIFMHAILNLSAHIIYCMSATDNMEWHTKVRNYGVVSYCDCSELLMC